MLCQRTTCPLPATVRLTVHFHSGSVLRESLCAEHAERAYASLLAKPQTRSGSRTPIPGAGALARVVAA